MLLSEPSVGQTTSASSRMAPARSMSSFSSVATFHLLRQPNEGTLRGFPRGIGRGFPQSDRKIFVAAAHFHACNDSLPFFRLKPGERCFVSLDRFGANCFLEGRRPPVRDRGIHGLEIRSTAVATQLLTYPIEESLTQVGLERAFATRLEPFDPLKCPKQGVLDKVLRVGRISGVSRQSPAGPTSKRGEVSSK